MANAAATATMRSFHGEECVVRRIDVSGGTNRVDLRWSELELFLVHREVVLVLSDGTSLRGRVLAVGPEDLAVEVERSSDRRVCALGRQRVPREMIIQLKARVARGVRGRIELTLVGLFGGLGAIAGLLYSTPAAERVYNAVALGFAAMFVIAGESMIGYWAGRSMDHRDVVVQVVAD